MNDILAEGRVATRVEIEVLFVDYVCKTACEKLIQRLSDNEIRRLVAIGIFEYNVLECKKDRKMVMDKIRRLLGLSVTTMYEYFPASTYKMLDAE